MPMNYSLVIEPFDVLGVETGEQFAGDLLELIFFCCAERGPELMQAVMLRW